MGKLVTSKHIFKGGMIIKNGKNQSFFYKLKKETFWEPQTWKQGCNSHFPLTVAPCMPPKCMLHSLSPSSGEPLWIHGGLGVLTGSSASLWMMCPAPHPPILDDCSNIYVSPISILPPQPHSGCCCFLESISRKNISLEFSVPQFFLPNPSPVFFFHSQDI